MSRASTSRNAESATGELRSRPRKLHGAVAALVFGASLLGCMQSEESSAGGATSASGTVDAAQAITADSRHVVELARAFAATLSEEQRSALHVAYSFSNASNWSNLPEFAMRHGRVGLGTNTLSPDQWAALNALLAAATGSTSNEGYDEIQQILNGDDHINKYGKRREGYGRDHYHVAFLGSPTTSGRWQLQFGGHHIAVNNTYVDGGLIGATPSFRGVEPFSPFEHDGVLNQPLAQEHMAFVSFLSSLNNAQLTAARHLRSPGDITAGPGEDWKFPTTPYGIGASALNVEQQAMLLSVIESYVKDIADESAARILANYERELDRTYVSYAGSMALNKTGDYVRIDGPSVWIELVMDAPFSFSQPHPHTVWRDKKADYGGSR